LTSVGGSGSLVATHLERDRPLPTNGFGKREWVPGRCGASRKVPRSRDEDLRSVGWLATAASNHSRRRLGCATAHFGLVSMRQPTTAQQWETAIAKADHELGLAGPVTRVGHVCLPAGDRTELVGSG
jgi:hypothetical protein